MKKSDYIEVIMYCPQCKEVTVHWMFSTGFVILIRKIKCTVCKLIRVY